MKWFWKSPAGAIAMVLSAGLVLWFFYRALKKSEDPVRLTVKWVFSIVLCVVMFTQALRAGPYGLFYMMICGLILAAIWASHLGALLASPLTSIFAGGDDGEDEVKPLYSIAEAKRKRGKYHEALAEVRKQLERFPNDFQGHMLLAEISVDHLRDLITAQESVEQIVIHPGHSPKNIAYALNRLADWQLQHALDPEAARLTLERIVELLPDTEYAQLARQRIAHLASSERLAEKHDRPAIAVPHFVAKIGLDDLPAEARAPADDPVRKAAEYVKHLEIYPDDNEAREKLALIYASHYQRLDLATNELEQLVSSPNQPGRDVVRWLNLLTDLQIRLSSDVASAKETLQRIVNQFPNSAAAENALTRMAHLNLELRATTSNRVVKLGTYQQNIGLNAKTKAPE